jgi:hypothetical protein
MPSADFVKFRDSMNIGYEEWHDGIGYDLEALGRLAGEEQRAAETTLLGRGVADWRDVDALDCLGSPGALVALSAALSASDVNVRLQAAKRLHERKLLSDGELETLVIAALDSATISNGMVKILDMAEAHPTNAIRQKLLWCARHGHDDIRVHAAALVHFLYGQSTSAFDWANRPLYLRFGESDPSERDAALAELCRDIAVDPASVA